MDDLLRESLIETNESFWIAWTRNSVRFEQEHNNPLASLKRLFYFQTAV
jgi:hypothetical protein